MKSKVTALQINTFLVLSCCINLWLPSKTYDFPIVNDNFLKDQKLREVSREYKEVKRKKRANIISI